MFLEQSTFSTVIQSTPLVSIDLVIKDEYGKVLLGERLNRPAQGFWFVPGGRILKNETLEQAFKRLTLNELGVELDIAQASLLGPYTHLYDDNVFNETGSTHYVALAYTLQVKRESLALPMDVQHAHYQWFEESTLLASEQVHCHTKWYFR